MAKQISSLSVALGGTVAPFASAFGGAGRVVQSFVGEVNGAASSLAHLTGATAAFGGAARAVRGSVGSLAGTFGTLTGAGLAVNALSGAFHELTSAPGEAIAKAQEAANAESNLRAVLLATGGAAGHTADDLMDFAKSLQHSTTFDDDSIIGFQSVLATFKNVSGDAFNEATRSALDMATVMHTDLQSTAVQLGKALNNPTKGIVALTKVGVSFTEQQKAQIKAMQASGDVAGAQAVILAELKGEFGGAAEAAAKLPFGQMKQLGNQFGDSLEQLGTILATTEVALAKAFNVSGAIDGLQSGLGWIQSALPTAIGYVTPAITSIVSAVETGAMAAWGYTQWAFGQAYGYVAPTMMQIAGVVSDNWQSVVLSTAGYGVALYNYISGLFSAAATIVSDVWSGVVAVWDWGSNLIGAKTESAGATTASVTQTMLDGWKSYTDGLAEVVNITGFALGHLTEIVQYTGVTAAYYLAELYNQTEYYLGAGIEYVKWFGTNFTQLIVDSMNLSLTITEHGVENVAKIISNLPGLIAGTTDLADIWTPLTEGFEARVSALPEIAARVPGELETALGDQSKEIGAGLVNGLFDQLNDADKRAGNVAKSINGALADIHLPKFDAAAASAFDPNAMTAGPKALVAAADDGSDALDKLAGKASKAAGEIKNIGSGSAEQWQRIARAQADRLKAAATPVKVNAAIPAKTKAPASNDMDAEDDTGDDEAMPVTGAINATTAAPAAPKGFDSPAWFKDAPASAAEVARRADRSRNWLGEAPSAMPSIGIESAGDAARRASRPLADAVTSAMPLRVGPSFATTDASNAPAQPAKVAASVYAAPVAQPVAASVQRDARDAAKATTTKAPVDNAQLMQKFDTVIQILRDKGLLAFQEVG